jgi:hypothetical protein
MTTKAIGTPCCNQNSNISDVKVAVAPPRSKDCYFSTINDCQGDRTKTKYCSICKKWFCDVCRTRKADRIRLMMQEKKQNIMEKFKL